MYPESSGTTAEEDAGYFEPDLRDEDDLRNDEGDADDDPNDAEVYDADVDL